MNRRLQYALATAGAVAMLLPHASHAAIIGQWDFNSGTLAATVGGAPLAYGDGAGGATQTGTQFGTTTALGVPDIGGTAANVMKFPAATLPGGYSMPINAGANGGGTLVNQWTLIMDVLFPAESNSKWRGLVDTDAGAINADSEWFVNTGNGIGIGSYAGVIQPNTWHRIALVVDQSEGVNRLRTYIDGNEVGVITPGNNSNNAGVDGRWALSPGNIATLFTDNDGETATGFVNSIQLHNEPLSRAQMAALGGATAAGLPTTLPPIPAYVENWIPKGAFGRTGTEVGVVLNKGTANVSAISAVYNGSNVTPTVSTVGDLISIKVPGATTTARTDHTLIIRYTDSAAGARSLTNRFRIPVSFEDFDSTVLGPNVDEGRAGEKVYAKDGPNGWTVDNSQMPKNATTGQSWEDPGIGVTEFKGWTFLDRDWWVATAGDQTRSQFQLGSGTVVVADPDEWDDIGNPDGTVGYFNSYLNSPEIPLAGVAANSLTLKFSSSWRPEARDDSGPDGQQTNDQTAVVRVTYDNGTPIEVLRWNSVQGSPTFKPDSQNEEVTLVLNNPAGVTRMKLSFGLLNAGNDWWWTVDNIVVDSGVVPATITQQPRTIEVEEGSTATLSVGVAGDAPLSFQWYRGVGPAKEPIDGATSASYSIPFVKATNSGIYSVRVANAGGGVDSAAATVNVILRNRPQILLHEHFDDLVLGPNVDEGVAGDKVWTKTGPAGWTIDDSGVPGAGDPENDGVTEWAGWSFADRQWWATTAGNQRRAEFLKGTGTVAVADGDEWDDRPRTAGSMNTFLSTPAISLANIQPGSVVLRFDSSWRPEEPQKAVIRVQFDNGIHTEILRWVGNTGSPDFHADNVNETVTMTINNPAGASTMKITWGYIDAGNNWWWAIDNVTVSGTPVGFNSLRDSLAAYLPFNGNLNDAAGGAVHGTAVGTVPFVAGKAGQGIHVRTAPGSSNYVTLGEHLRFGTNRNFTVAFWAQLISNADDQSLIGNKNWDGGSNPGWVISPGGNRRVQWNLNTVGGARKDYDGPANVLTDGTWRHIAVSFDRTGNAITYVDGAQVDSRSIAGNLGQPLDAPGLYLNIGQDGTGRYRPAMEAVIDEVAFWWRPLEPAEVARAHSQGAAGLGLFEAAPTTTVTLNVNGLPGGAFTNPVVDEAGRTITVDMPASGDTSFLSISPSRAITSVQLVNGKLVIKW